MTPDRWQKIERIFYGALDCEPEKRSSFLDQACEEDEELRREIELLVKANDASGAWGVTRFHRLMAAEITDQLYGSIIGQTLGHYRVDILLGSGGMGSVYQAQDIKLNRRVALKLLPSYLTIDPNRMQRFEREAQAASALNHPNIITIYDIGESEAGRFIVMELVEGRTLSSLDKPCAMEMLVSLGGQIARALSATHAAGITHRDIKPDNIMVRKDGYVKILDFGLARLMPSATTDTEAKTIVQQTAPGSLLGTVAYMSPEQARGETTGRAGDIFALGIILYELATGEHPFKACSMVDLLHAIASQAPKPPSRLMPEIPLRFESLILRMLEKEAHLRPTADEVVQVMEGLAGRLSGGTHSNQVVKRQLIGREKERIELRSAYNLAKIGRGSMLCLTGEPGIGKTTLVEDFLTELAAEGQCTIARGCCSRRLAGVEAYRPLLKALGNLLRDSSNPAASRVLKQVAPTWYAQVVPLSGKDEESVKLLANVKTATQERMKWEILHFLQEVARLRPLVLFFDDMHWTDVSTIDVLSFLSGKFDGLNILIIATDMPSNMQRCKDPLLQIRSDLKARGLCRELRLGCLNIDEIAGYLESEFHGHHFPSGFTEMIYEKTEGHPLFLSELVTYLRDRRMIAEEKGLQDGGSRWVLTKSLSDIEGMLPKSMCGMIKCKIRQLDDMDRKLLVAASVQDCAFDSAVVARVLDIEVDKIEERLLRLEKDHSVVKMIDEFEFSDGTLTRRYRFVHMLYQNAMLKSLKASRKAALNRAVAQTMVDLYGERSESMANELATLFEAGCDYARAAEYYRLAAQAAVRVHANQEAILLARQGLKMVGMLPDTNDRMRHELALIVALLEPLAATQGLTSSEFAAHYTRARDLTRQLGDSSQILLTLNLVA